MVKNIGVQIYTDLKIMWHKVEQRRDDASRHHRMRAEEKEKATRLEQVSVSELS